MQPHFHQTVFLVNDASGKKGVLFLAAFFTLVLIIETYWRKKPEKLDNPELKKWTNLVSNQWAMESNNQGLSIVGRGKSLKQLKNPKVTSCRVRPRLKFGVPHKQPQSSKCHQCVAHTFDALWHYLVHAGTEFKFAFAHMCVLVWFFESLASWPPYQGVESPWSHW